MFRHFCNILVVVINILAALALLVTAYAGRISPETSRHAPIVCMAFAFVLPCCLLIFIFDLIWWRRSAWIMGLAMLACVEPIHNFMPLNLPHLWMNQEQKEHSFTLMSYNVAKFIEQNGVATDHSRQLSYILEKSPDIVCIQESNFLAPNSNNHLLQTQLDSLHSMYPYVFTQGEDLALFSKFPAKPINIDYPTKSFPSGDIGAWRLTVHGKVLNIFSVHLCSLGLSPHDKEAFRDVVKIDEMSRSDLIDLKGTVVNKISKASKWRLKQVRQLQKYLAKYGGRDAIVCGDFNDPVGSYPLHLLCDESHMRQAYSDVAFGPDYSFYANKMYFRIDHILYRGNLQPWSLRIRHFKASDHFPTIATFIIN